MDSKECFLFWLRHYVKRDGIENLIKWLVSTDFFTAPASTQYHNSFEGGLVEHSINVFDRFNETDNEKRAICGLLHDVCKANFYKKDFKNVKNDAGVWVKVPCYKVEDDFPYGHGEKSVYLISRHMALTDEEAMAIRWHMGFSDESFKGGSYALSNAFEKYPLAVSLHIADLQATYFDERKQQEE